MIMSDKYQRVVPFSDESFVYNVCGIISLGKEKYPSFERKDINERFFQYFSYMLDCGLVNNFYFIFHDEIKDNPHIHYALNLPKQIRITTMCNKIAQNCSVPTLSVTIDKMLNLVNMLVYFIHDTDVEKFQYQVSDIISNQNNDVVESYFEKVEDTNRVDYYLNLCFELKNKIEIMKIIGIKEYHKYRYEIAELWDYAQMNRFEYLEKKRKYLILRFNFV